MLRLQQTMRHNHTKRLTLSALLVAVMLVLGYLESLLPAGPVPGIKLGLSNSVLLLAILWLGIPEAFCLMACKVVLSGLLFAGVSAMMFSFAGGLLSMIVMALLTKFRFGIVVTGMAGGLAHNVGQVALAIYVLQTNKLYYYMAVLMFVGLLTGFATGSAAKLLQHRLPSSLLPESKQKDRTE